MHHLLTRTIRRRAAALLMVAYAVGVLAPAVAVAHADRSAIAHLLSETHGDALTLHFHAEADRHEHSGKGDAKLAHHCCGVVAPAGLEPPDEPAIVEPAAARLHFASAREQHAGLGAARLDRPPR